MDITYISMAKGFVYLTCVMDIYSRKLLSSVISNTLDARFCVEAYEEAVTLYESPEIINTDQGSYSHLMRLSQQLLHQEQDSAWMETGLGQTTFSSCASGAHRSTKTSA
jgi:putative transposase